MHRTIAHKEKQGHVPSVRSNIMLVLLAGQTRMADNLVAGHERILPGRYGRPLAADGAANIAIGRMLSKQDPFRIVLASIILAVDLHGRRLGWWTSLGPDMGDNSGGVLPQTIYGGPLPSRGLLLGGSGLILLVLPIAVEAVVVLGG